MALFFLGTQRTYKTSKADIFFLNFFLFLLQIKYKSEALGIPSSKQTKQQ